MNPKSGKTLKRKDPARAAPRARAFQAEAAAAGGGGGRGTEGRDGAHARGGCVCGEVCGGEGGRRFECRCLAPRARGPPAAASSQHPPPAPPFSRAAARARHPGGAPRRTEKSAASAQTLNPKSKPDGAFSTRRPAATSTRHIRTSRVRWVLSKEPPTCTPGAEPGSIAAAAMMLGYIQCPPGFWREIRPPDPE